MLSTSLSTTGAQAILKATAPADSLSPGAMLEVLAHLMARNDGGDGRYYRLNCDSSGRLKTLFGAHIATRYRTAKTVFEEQGGFSYGIALNRMIVTNSSAASAYVYMCDQSAALVGGDGSDFPIMVVPALSHLAVEWLYPITTSNGLRFGLSNSMHTAGAPDYRPAGAIAKWLVECSS